VQIANEQLSDAEAEAAASFENWAITDDADQVLSAGGKQTK
jgi:hypothetical protein